MDSHSNYPCWSVLGPSLDRYHPVPEDRAIEVVGEKAFFTFPHPEVSKHQDIREVGPVLVWVVNPNHQTLVRGWGAVNSTTVDNELVKIQDGANPHPQP